MWNNSALADVEFSFPHTKSKQRVVIPAHSFVLAISSPVFFDMFCAESRVHGLESFEVTDSDYENFQNFLLYLYSDELKLTKQCFRSFFYLATKYRVTSLVEQCVKFVVDNLDSSNILAALSCAELIEKKDLKSRCWELLDFHVGQVVKSKDFLKIGGDLMSRVLQRDLLRIREVELFKAFNEWITFQDEAKEASCWTNPKNSYRHLVNWIRFPLMTRTEFAETVPRTNLLSEDQIIDMFLFFSSVSEANPGFSQKPRAATVQRCALFTESRQWFMYSGNCPEYLTFLVNSPFRLFGVRLFGSIGGKYSVLLEIYPQNHTTSILFAKKGVYESDKEKKDGYYGFDVTLDRPLWLKKETPYTFKLLLQGPPSFYGCRGFSTVECSETTFTFCRVNDSVSSRFHAGQFAEILFLD